MVISPLQNRISPLRNAHYPPYEDDFAAARPTRRRSKRNIPFWQKALNALASNPKRLVVGALFAGVALSVGGNALMMQSSPHPAPMFSPRLVAKEQAPQIPPARPPVETPRMATAQVPVPAQVPVAASSANTASPERDVIGDIIRTGSTASAPVPVRPAAATKAPSNDVIGDLIRMNGVPPARPGEQHAASSGAAHNVAASPDAIHASNVIMTGQQALNKLGYGPLDADGVMGGGTKKAIERFEFDRRLPVTGTFNARTVSELSSRSRLAIR